MKTHIIKQNCSLTNQILLVLSPVRWLVLGLVLFCFPRLEAQIPDLTAGDPVPADPTPLYINLGPTGMEGWMYRSGQKTTASRQILVTSAAAGSPAAGILAVNDVILGADGTGATATNFTADARKRLAYAIADAEARSPATLSLLRWRAGTTTPVTLTLQTLGAYSATAPFNCPKSAAVLEQSLNYDIANASPDSYAFIALAMMAADDPANPNNAARQAFAQTEARKLILPQSEIDAALGGVIPTTTKVTWDVGHELITLAEYYRKTGDAMVYDSLRARAHQAANGSSLFGTHGHQFVVPDANGSINGSYRHGYGTMNNASVTCFLGLVLAREAGLNDPVIEAAIQRAEAFYGSYANKGVIPYSEDYPYNNTTDNGKSAQLAMCMRAIEGREAERNHFARAAISSHTQRDSGHQGSWFNYIWSPLGAAAAGEEAASAYFREISWMLDLNRRWDGSFEYNQLHTSGSQGGDSYQAKGLLMSSVAQLTYALPLRQLFITGRDINPVESISEADAADAAFASGYSGSSYTTAELLTHLGHIHPFVRNQSASELGNRTAEYPTLLPTLTNMANDINGGNSRYGACRALGSLSDGSGAPALVPLLTDPDPMVRYNAAAAFNGLNNAIVKNYKEELMIALAANSTPFFPLDPQDPFRWGDTYLSATLFGKALVDGVGAGLQRNLLYPAIEAGLNLNNAMSWLAVSGIYKYLTEADLEEIAGGVLDTTAQKPVGNAVSASGVTQRGVEFLGKYQVAEGVPLSIPVYHESDDTARTTILGVLDNYAGGCLTVDPDPEVIDFLYYVIQQHGSQRANAQAVLAAIDADPNPVPLRPFKAINSATADSPVLTMPQNWTTLRADSHDHAKGESIYTWRKVQGPGNVTFGPNATGSAKDTAVIFDGTPGIYTLEVTMSDQRGLTEVRRAVTVELRDSGGNLPPNSPPTASPVSVTAFHGTPTPIQLHGSDPEGQPLVYTVTSNPSEGTLEGSGANFVFTPNYDFTGVDSFTYEVMDTFGQVATATVTINVGQASNVGLAVYEPFDYPVGPLNAASGTSEVGLTGAWGANTSINVASGNHGFSSLVTTGNSLNPPTETTISYGGKRDISTAALAGAGLLDDGATLWMSAVMGMGSDDWTNSLALALASNPFSNSGNQFWIVNDGAELGRGVGIMLEQRRAKAMLFGDQSGGGLVGSEEAISVRLGPNERHLFVLKISWGATTDLIEVYQVQSDMNLASEPISILTVNVDQSKFDTITFTRKRDFDLDEIRIGATYQSVLQGSVAMTADTTAPVPDPMSFEIGAHMSSPDSISMKASSAFDSHGVEYFFNCTAGGGNDSGWQDSPSYTDTGLTPGVTYSYTVKARDKSPAANETAASAATSAIIPVQATVPFVAGVPRIAGEQAIVDANLTVGNVISQASTSVPEGHIISASPIGGSSAAYGTAVDLVVSLGFPTIAPADFTDDAGAPTVGYSSLIIYTLTFSKDMDETTLGASDFSNAGTSPITIGPISEVSPGVFTVEVTPTALGTLRLQISAGAVVGDHDGLFLDTTSAIADDTLLTVNDGSDVTPPNPNQMTWAVLPDAGAGIVAGAILSTDFTGQTVSGATASNITWTTRGVQNPGELTTDAPAGLFNTSATQGFFAPDRNLDTEGPWSVNIPITTTESGVKLTSVAFNYQNFTNSGGLQSTARTIFWTATVTGSVSGPIANPTATTNNTSGTVTLTFSPQLILSDSETYTVTLMAEGNNSSGNNTGLDSLTFYGEALGGDPQTQIIMTATTATDISGVEYYFTETSGNPGGTDSGWQSSQTFLATGLSPGMQYTYTVTARDLSAAHNMTAPSIAASATTEGIPNFPPSFTNDPLGKPNATTGTAYTGSLSGDATDPEGEPMTFSKTSGSAWLNVAANGTLSGTPTVGDVGSNSFTVSVSDGFSSTQATMILTVNGSSSIGSVSVVNSGSKVALSTKSTSLSFNAGATADKLVVVVSSERSAVGTPVVTYNGVPMTAASLGTGRAAGIWYLDNPYTGGAANITVDFTSYTTVNGIGMAAVSLNDTAPGYTVADTNASNTLSLASTLENSVAVVGFGVNGGGTTAANAPMTQLYGADNIGSAAGAAGYHNIATAGANTYSFTSASTSNPAVVGAIFGPSVTVTNQPPLFTTDPIAKANAIEDAGYSGTLVGNASDPDGNSLTHAKVDGPAWLSVAANGSLSGTPTNADVGANSFTVSVTDGNSPAVEVSLLIEVINTNDAPVTHDQSVSTDEDVAQAITLTASDLDGDPLGYSVVTGPANGALTGTAPNLTYTPNDNYFGADSFRFVANDGTTDSSTAIVSIAVNAVNDAPVFANDPIAGADATADAPYSGTLAGSATDDDGDVLSYGKVSGPAWLSVATDGTFGGTPNSADVGASAFTVSVSDGVGSVVAATLNLTVVSRSKLLRTTLTAVGSDSWQTVDLGRNYNSAVIIATPVLPNHTHPPVVTRLRNVSGSTFDIKIQRVDGQTGAVAVDVKIVAVEEGVYTLANDGLTMEAVKYTSTITAENNDWVAESQTYQNAYTNPVVVGQIMSANDANWSVFWCQGSSRTIPPSASSLSTGKHVGEDPNIVRANETIGYIVIQAGAGSMDGINLVAGLGGDTVQGPGDSASGYTYSMSGLSSASTVAVSLAAMDGGDGGFAVLTGTNPVTPNSLTLYADEDQLKDTERKHSTEQVGYIIFE